MSDKYDDTIHIGYLGSVYEFTGEHEGKLIFENGDGTYIDFQSWKDVYENPHFEMYPNAQNVTFEEFMDIVERKEKNYQENFELRELLRAYDEDGRSASSAHWMIGRGGYDLDFELYRDREAVIQCIAGKLENVSLSEDEFHRIGSIIKEEYPDVQLPNMTNDDLYKFVEIINPNNELGWTLAQSDGEGIVPGTLIIEKVDEMNVFEDDYEASLAAAQKGVPFIMGAGIEDFLYVNTAENKKLVFEAQKEDVVPVVDWRGFTERDFENLQADKMYTPGYEFNRNFYAGDLKISIMMGSHWNRDLVDISFWMLEKGDTFAFVPVNIKPTNLQFDIKELKGMTYEEFQAKLEKHLYHITHDSKFLRDEEKEKLLSSIETASPKSWTYEDLYELTALSKALIKEDGKTLSYIEKEYVLPKPMHRKNVLLHGGSKNLMKKLTKELEKDKEIKKILSNQKGR